MNKQNWPNSNPQDVEIDQNYYKVWHDAFVRSIIDIKDFAKDCFSNLIIYSNLWPWCYVAYEAYNTIT